MKRVGGRTLVRTRWSTLFAVCSECRGGKRLAKSLRASVKHAGLRDVRVVRSSCLDVCPKRGVTVATLADGCVRTAVVDAEFGGRAALDALRLPAAS